MCDSWQKPSPDDLSVAELEAILRQLPPMDAVRLTGGEPFVRKDLLDITHLVQAQLRPLVLHVTTNGFLTRRIVEFCERRRKDVDLHLLVSVDGYGEKHNQVRGQAFAWDRVVETVEALAPRRRELRLKLAVNQTVVDAEGLEHHSRLREWLGPLDVHNQVVLAYDASATYDVRPEQVATSQIGAFTPFGTFAPGELEALVDVVEADVEHFAPAERLAKRYYVRGLRQRVVEGRAWPNPPCVALNSHLRIFPNGDVPTCQMNTTVVGNLRSTPFAEVWASARALEQRSWVERCAGCWAECEVLPSALYSGDIVRALA